MKYRVKTKIDDTDKDDLVMVQGLFGFLAELTEKKVIYDEACKMDDIIDSSFCSQCEMDNDNCECARDAYYERDWDYDEVDERNDPEAINDSETPV